MNVIEFPKLGITMNINPEAFHIGEKPIYWYALIILTGFILGFFFIFRDCEKRGVKRENLWDIALYGLFFGIIGARIYYVLFSLDEFDGILDMLAIWNGGLAIYGGIIAGAITIFIYCKIMKLPVLNVFDVCVPALFIGQAVGRFGNFVNAEVYGGMTSLPWGMKINGFGPVHPLFLYESLWNILGLIILLIFRNKKTSDGQIFCFYVFWYSFGRLFLEGMRDQMYILYLIPNVLGISQAVAIAAMIFAVLLFIYVTRHKRLAASK